MLQLNRIFEIFRVDNFFKPAVLSILICGLSIGISAAQQPGQKRFPSPDEASRALFIAVQKGDLTALVEILGPAGKELISSGDEVEDQNGRNRFVQKYQEMHRLAKETDGTTTLYIGGENWPLPIPLVSKEGEWFYDTETGKEEILFRRIGKNELAAIRVCHELVDAQKEYHSRSHGGSGKQYARKFVSDDGKEDGLYWKPVDGGGDSPIGPLVAFASREGYPEGQSVGSSPFQGYYYRILTRQGKNAPGGVKDYLANGKLTRGFAFLAYPAGYGTSGVMTFIVNQSGVVYQKDLGPKTTEVAEAVKEYDPDSTWQKAE